MTGDTTAGRPSAATDDESWSGAPERLGRAECVRLLGTASVGRIAFSDRALPAVVPVTYAVDDDHVVVRTAAGSRLAVAAADAILAFEVDEVEPALRCGWSVTVLGRGRVVTDPLEADRLRALVTPWAPGERDVVVLLPLTIVEGRRIAPRPGLAAS